MSPQAFNPPHHKSREKQKEWHAGNHLFETLPNPIMYSFLCNKLVQYWSFNWNFSIFRARQYMNNVFNLLWDAHLHSAIINSYHIVIRNKDKDRNLSFYWRWLQLLEMCRRSFAQRHLDRTSFPDICVPAAKSEMRSKMHINSQSSDQRWLLRGLHRRRRLFSHGRTWTGNRFAPQTELLLSLKLPFSRGWLKDRQRR